MPVYTKTIISNMALSHCCHGTQIGAVETDLTNPAKYCRLWFDHVTQLLLESRMWPAFTRQVDLQDLGSAPNGWDYRYKYPTNCAYAGRIVNPQDPNGSLGKPKIPFEVKDLDDGYGKCILTNEPNAVLEMNIIADDPNKFDSTFAEAHSLMLAAHVSGPLRVDANIKAEINRQLTGWMSEAAVKAMRERQDDREPDSEFVSIRG